MSNHLVVTVGSFFEGGDKEKGEPEFGYFVADDYWSAAYFSWDEDAFYKQYPTAESLWEDVLSLKQFEDIDIKKDDDGNILFEKDGDMIVPVKTDMCSVSSFSLEGYNNNNPYANNEPESGLSCSCGY